MIQNLVNALIITGIGMGLVFAAILLLWGVMALLVRLTAEKPERSPEGLEFGEEGVLKTSEPSAAELQSSLRRRVAAAAVAAALAAEAEGPLPHRFPLPAASSVTAWQGVNRTRMLNKRGRIR